MNRKQALIFGIGFTAIATPLCGILMLMYGAGWTESAIGAGICFVALSIVVAWNYKTIPASLWPEGTVQELERLKRLRDEQEQKRGAVPTWLRSRLLREGDLPPATIYHGRDDEAATTLSTAISSSWDTGYEAALQDLSRLGILDADEAIAR
jgi:hypothetical protein